MLFHVALVALVGVSFSAATQCGIKGSTGSRIVNGQDAVPGEWPWQVGILYSGRKGGTSPFCGGTLVSDQWVVTAQHCISVKNPKRPGIKVRLGAHNRVCASSIDCPLMEEIEVSKVVSHQSYNSPVGMAHDLTLLKLKTPVTFKSHIKPACLPDQSIPAPSSGDICFITGWGTTKYQGSTPKVLQEAQVPIVSSQVCNAAYAEPNDLNPIHASMICAGNQVGVITDTCQGDSGGPLVCIHNGQYYLQGATSWGYRCADPNYYGVYTNIHHLKQWISTQMNAN